MKERFQKHTSVWISAGVSLAWLLARLASKIVAETTDDVFIALMIYQSPDHLCLFVHPAYSKFFGMLFECMPRINWWTVFTILGIACAVYSYSCMLMKRFDGYRKWIAVIAVLTLV